MKTEERHKLHPITRIYTRTHILTIMDIDGGKVFFIL